MNSQEFTRRGYSFAAKALCLIAVFLIVPSISFGWSGECVWVKDGDSIVVMHDGKPEEIRLHGINCPECDQPFGLEAARLASGLVLGKTVDVQVLPEAKRSYGRTIATVHVEGKSLNQELVRLGMAWWSRKYAPDDKDLERLQQEAVAAKIGIWSQPNPIPPWLWKQVQQER
ncbi:MAG: thermonuclease family protein [Thermodesulfobacteriota bacterium]